MDLVASSVFFHLVKQRNRKELFRFLPSSELEKFQTIEVSSRDPFSACLSTKKRLGAIHYSWLIPFLESFEQEDKELLISSLPPAQKKGLKKYFQLKYLMAFPKEKIGEYVINLVYEWVISQQKEKREAILPVEWLPDHPLNALVDLNKKQLQTLIDYLGLYDLRLELKQIVRSKQIKKIDQIFSEDQRNYLKQSIYGKKHLTFVRLNLDHWQGDEDELKRVLHQRGLNRLAKALFGCDSSLLWHISHRLDTGRAKVLYRFSTDIKNEKGRLILIDQILDLIEHVKSMQIK